MPLFIDKAHIEKAALAIARSIVEQKGVCVGWGGDPDDILIDIQKRCGTLVDGRVDLYALAEAAIRQYERDQGRT